VMSSGCAIAHVHKQAQGEPCPPAALIGQTGWIE
jgi:hypothetical protein